MKGYIYTMFQGADPGAGWKMTDPIYGNPPTMGACMPQIRRSVSVNDYIFSISGRTKGVEQYIVGGFQVKEKMDALLARDLYPEYRQIQKDDGSLEGNIIVNEKGEQNPFDYHSGNFERRIENYIIGKNSIYLESETEVEKARGQATMEILQEVFEKKGKKPHDVIGRWRRMNDEQIYKLSTWMQDLKSS